MTENEAIKLVQSYLKLHTFQGERVDTTKIPFGKKSPDLEVLENNKLVFYCEVKTPSLKQNKQTGMFNWSTTHSKLRGFIHQAVKQFIDYDPKHTLPWVIAFTSDNFQLNWSNFCHCIQGAVAYNGQIVKDLNNTRFIQDTNKDLLSTEMIVWFQINPKDKRVCQMKLFINQQARLFAETKRISDLLTPSDNEKIAHYILFRFFLALLFS